jgi:hypothetical protein
VQVVEYGGVRREIINRKPQLVDDDGYAVDSDDDDEQIQQALAATAQFDPYANIRIDEILAPLTAITDLPTHPTLSRPFTSTVLTGLSNQSSAIMRKENQSLWKTKRLYTQLCGDYDRVVCEMMMTPDGALELDDHTRRLLGSSQAPPKKHNTLRDMLRDDQARNGDSGAPTAKVNGHAPHEAPTSSADGDGEVVMADVGTTEAVEDADAVKVDGSAHMDEDKAENSQDHSTGAVAPTEGDNARMFVTADASDPPIHPLFRPPPNARPDRNIGLPDEEAETLRKLLMLWVQKQEEVCRGITRLNNGLLKADRLRQEVLHWAKAEAHCGPNRDISDGEDWYDKERWGLVDDLKKGDDEVEEEETGPAAKKTRARR